MFYKMKFNDIDFSDKFFIEEIRRPLFQDLAVSTSEIPAKAGVIFKRQDRRGKTIEVDIRIIKDTKEKMLKALDNIKPFLLSLEPKKLELSDMPDRYEIAVLDGSINLKTFLSTGFATLVFLVPSGTSFSKEEFTGTTNAGTCEAFWKLKGTYTSGDISIINTRTSERIDIDMTGYSTGSKIEIDFEKELVRIGESIDLRGLNFNSDFWLLKVGENPITTSGLSNIEITHRRQFL